MTASLRDQPGLPRRQEVVLRGACILTMDQTIGDLSSGDIRIVDGVIEDVGTVETVGPDALELDMRDRVVLPGFVDTHWHLWSSVLRGLVGDGDRSYFPVKNRLAPAFSPEDTFHSVRLGLAEAVMAGITTVNDWDHNARSPAHADAHGQAILASGLRARYSYGNADKLDPAILMDLEDVNRFQRDWCGPAGDGRLTIGMAVRGPVRTTPEVCRAEWTFAREHGIPMTMHCGGRRSETGRYCEIAEMRHLGMLGPDLQIVHAVAATDAEIEDLAVTGTTLSLSPLTEYSSMGIPPLGSFLEAGIPVSLSIDTLALPTTADMFRQMKATLAVERARTGGPTLTPRRVLELATIDGARGLGLDRLIGSLRPGKRADLIAVRLDSLNMSPPSHPLDLVVHAATPADVDLVMADGRIVKQDGEPVTFEVSEVVQAARRTIRGILDRAGWDPLTLDLHGGPAA